MERNKYLENLAVMLERLGQPRTWLCDAIGISYATANNWFLRNSFPSLDVAVKVSRHLGVSVEDMMLGDARTFQPANLSRKKREEKRFREVFESLSNEEVAAVEEILKLIIDFKRDH